VDEDEQGRWGDCGCDIVDGQLRVLFAKSRIGLNIYDAVEAGKLLKALNEAPPAADCDSELTLLARTSIRQDWDPEIEATRKEAADLLERPDFKFEPNWVENFKMLKAEAAKKRTELRDDWERSIGYWTRHYFEEFVRMLREQKFGEDDMLKDGFNEAVEKGVVAFRLLEKLKDAEYCECVIEDGVCYLQVSFALADRL
jgi:hypothetical protein